MVPPFANSLVLANIISTSFSGNIVFDSRCRNLGVLVVLGNLNFVTSENRLFTVTHVLVRNVSTRAPLVAPRSPLVVESLVSVRILPGAPTWATKPGLKL